METIDATCCIDQTIIKSTKIIGEITKCDDSFIDAIKTKSQIGSKNSHEKLNKGWIILSKQ